MFFKKISIYASNIKLMATHTPKKERNSLGILHTFIERKKRDSVDVRGDQCTDCHFQKKGGSIRSSRPFVAVPGAAKFSG